MTYAPLTQEQFQSARKAGFSNEKIIEMEQKRKQDQDVSRETPTTPVPEESFVRKAAGAVGNFGVGVAKGVGSTVFGVGQLADKILPGEFMPDEKPEYLKPKGTAQNIGFGAEQIGEFLIPAGLALKGVKAIEGVSALNKLSQAGKAGKFTSGALKLGGKSAIGATEAAGVRALQTGGDVEEVKTAAGYGALGAVALAGGAKVYKGIKGGLTSRAARQADELRLLKGEPPPPPPGAPPAGPSGPAGPIADARIATKTLNESGKVVTDKVAKEAVRQGIPEADVALIKAGTAGDKTKMAKMLDIRQSQLTNKRVVDRATDVVGDTFVEKIAKPIEKLNKEAGQRLEVVARRLSGKKVDPSPAVTEFGTSLENSGITVRANGTLNFKNSNFEGLKGAQTLITNVWNRAIRVARTGDALQLHRTKTYIDEIVNYGKQVDGLSGKAQTMLKEFRHDIDGILDTKFHTYNKVNTQFAETITELNNMGAAIGRTFKLGDTFADAQAGLAMRRILSNTASRSEILKLLENMQKVGQKYGIKIDEDIITQSNFADVLEKMLGSEAPTSFLGQGERFTGQALSAGGDIARGTPSGLISGTIKAGKYAIDVTRGINQENKINALRALLKNAPKLSNFGVTK